MRFTRIPEKNAVSLLSPMANIDRPARAPWSTTPNTAASTTKIPSVQANSVPGMGPRRCSSARSGTAGSSLPGKPVTELLCSTISARPRYRVSVPMVTARDGRPGLRHEHAVEGATGDSDGQDGDYGHGERPTVLEQVAEDGTGQSERRGDRQVDLARDHDQCQRERHKSDRPDVEAEVEEVGAGEEVGRNGRTVQNGPEQETDERHLPATERSPVETRPPARARAGARLALCRSGVGLARGGETRGGGSEAAAASSRCCPMGLRGPGGAAPGAKVEVAVEGDGDQVERAGDRLVPECRDPRGHQRLVDRVEQ